MPDRPGSPHGVWRPLWPRATVGAAVLAIAVATLGPGDPTEPVIEAFCVRCGNYWLTDLLANVALFLPLGIALAWCRIAPWRAAVVGLLLSSGVEVWQLLVVTGRDASVTDVVTNCLGALVGALLARHLPSVVVPSPVQARRWLFAGALLLTVGTPIIARLLLPSAGRGPLYLQVEPEVEDVRLRRVSAVRIDGVPAPWPGRIADSARVRAAIRAGALALSATVAPDVPPTIRTPLVRITPPHVVSVAELVADTDEWRGSMGVLAEDYGLRGLQLALPMAREAAARPVTLRVSRRGPHLALTTESAGAVAEQRVSLTALDAWIPFAPFRLVARGSWVLGRLAVVLLVPLVLGWWAGRSFVRGALVVAGVSLVAAALGPTLTAGLAAPPRWAWGVAACALLVGGRAGTASRSRR